MSKQMLALCVAGVLLAGCGAPPTGTPSGAPTAVAANGLFGFKLKEADYKPSSLADLNALLQNRGSGKVRLQGWFQFARTSAGFLTKKQAWVVFSDQQDGNSYHPNAVTIVRKDFNGLIKGSAFPNNAYDWFNQMGLVDKDGAAVTAFFNVRDGQIETDGVKFADGTVRTRPTR